MKTNIALLAFLASATFLSAAPLTAPTAVHAKPDASSPTISLLKAGSEPAIVPDSLASTPNGWLAIQLPGPFEAYVQNKDIQKSLDVRDGAAIHLAPKSDSAVLTRMEPSDRAEITGLHGKWTQIRLEKQLTGYIHVGGAELAKPVAAGSRPAAAPAPMAPAPVAPTAQGVTTAGQPAPMTLTDASGATLPRLFQGKFVSTRSPFKPRRPYDWALNDDAGKRYAFLDISKLLLTEQIESYVDHVVVVYGAAKTAPDGKDIVIEVESLQLK
ncbi:MAG TPA: hypothetical protein VEQ65_04290 [Opitutus sp.]|nr:hypothetical protein [Opitutus sp.]